MTLELYDSTPAKPGEPHGPKGPTHVATIRDIDYDYQIEMWLAEVVNDYPDVVRALCVEDGRVWIRQDQGFVLSPIVAP